MIHSRYRRWFTAADEDKWLNSLSHGPRALFKALVTSSRAETCGTVRASIDIVSRMVGYDKNVFIPKVIARALIKSQIKKLYPKVMWWPEDEVLWVYNFTRYQGKGSKFMAGAINRATDMPEHIRTVILKRLRALSDTVPDTLSDTSSDTHARASRLSGYQANKESVSVLKVGDKDAGQDTHTLDSSDQEERAATG